MCVCVCVCVPMKSFMVVNEAMFNVYCVVLYAQHGHTNINSFDNKFFMRTYATETDNEISSALFIVFFSFFFHFVSFNRLPK